MREARRTGQGARLEEWRFTAHELSSACDQVLSWCREVVATCRRPFGIDAFDLAVACHRGGNGGVDSQRFLSLRPLDLYTEGLAAQLTALVAGSRQDPSPIVIAAALFSWGDAADRALPTRT